MKTLDVSYSYTNTQIFFDHSNERTSNLLLEWAAKTVPQGMPDFYSSDGLDLKPAAHHSFFPDPSLGFLPIKSKPRVCRERTSVHSGLARYMAGKEQEHTPRPEQIWEYVQAINLEVITLI